jgi:hypothetical protein
MAAYRAGVTTDRARTASGRYLQLAPVVALSAACCAERAEHRLHQSDGAAHVLALVTAWWHASAAAFASASDPLFIVMPKEQARRPVATLGSNPHNDQSPPRWRALDTAAD